jgi:pyrimidine-nucleoside phosphorylase
VRSGETVDLSVLGRRVVDKHSTGGVGDKTSIALGPVVAACGVPFAKMSGRGLGHTGGTLDKLESVPGFRVEVDREAFIRQVGDVGMAIIGQTADLVPADRRLYALRDVTATIEEISLIAASIMSKKIAAGADAILLDVKVGEGAFMKTLADAQRLASTMLDLGRRAGRRVVCELTRMEQPLGRAVGNALEMREALTTLRGEGPDDFTELVFRSAAQLLALSDLGIGEEEGRSRAEAAVASGAALAAYERWIAAQGGNPREEALPAAPVVHPVPAPATGFVRSLSALGIGRAALHLGAGRSRKEERIDHATGVICLAKLGDAVAAGEPIAEVHARDEASATEAADEVAACYELGPEAREATPLFLEVMR